MSSYAYLDESGTKDDQHCMVVALAVFSGGRTAERLHLQIIQALYPKIFKTKTRFGGRASIHYADMGASQRRLVSSILSNVKVTVYASTYQHQGQKSHKEYFTVYQHLVHQAAEAALKEYKDLVVTIAKQGGWQTYQQSFLASLRNIPKKGVVMGRFAKAKFFLDSASNPGIQLADFYAGAVRENILLATDKSLSCNYELIAHQYKSIESYQAGAIK